MTLVYTEDFIDSILKVYLKVEYQTHQKETFSFDCYDKAYSK